MPSTDHRAVIGIVFSKDRALQLDAALRSFFRHCRDPEQVSLTVIYAGSSRLSLDQYCQLQHDFPTAEFIAQGDFRQDVFDLVRIPVSRVGRFAVRAGLAKRPDKRLVMFLVDDNIFVRDFGLADVARALHEEEGALGFALQMGRNLNYCYPLDLPLEFPAAIPVLGDIVKYRWPDAGRGLDYPLEVSSSLYRLGDVARLLAGLDFRNPNMLETHMAARAGSFRRTHPYLLCFTQSVTFCNPVNRVQSDYANRAGDSKDRSAASLAQLFERGYRVDVARYDGFVPSSCHQEVDLALSKLE
jgi:hypothetical protein